MSMSRSILFCLAVFILSSLPASAQDTGRFQLGAQLVTATVDELDATDIGVSGRIAWLPTPLIGVEAELALFPSDLPEGDAPTSPSRVEGLFGVTVGPRFGAFRLFGRLRPGFVQFSEAPPIACVAIFPPPLQCTLAAGHTAFAFDIGGGAEARVASGLSFRVDLGDRLVRYPGPAIEHDGNVQDEAFFAHGFRFAIGAGWDF